MLSMKLAAVNPRMDFKIDSLIAPKVSCFPYSLVLTIKKINWSYLSNIVFLFCLLPLFSSFDFDYGFVLLIERNIREAHFIFNVVFFPHISPFIRSFQMGFLIDSSFPSLIPPPIWPEDQVHGTEEQLEQQWHFNTLHQTMWGKEFDAQNPMNPEVSLLSYDSSANASKDSQTRQDLI